MEQKSKKCSVLVEWSAEHAANIRSISCNDYPDRCLDQRVSGNSTSLPFHWASRVFLSRLNREASATLSDMDDLRSGVVCEHALMF